jgi:hypothetical protein
MTRGASFSAVVAIAAAVRIGAQQMPDRSFRPMIEDRAYAIGTGPVVCFDEGHHNAHPLAEGFWPFADLVRRDGYLIRATAARLEPSSLADCRILVVVAPRSTVVGAESVRRWVAGGGSLLVIADRDARANIAALASAFGVTFIDDRAEPVTFRVTDKSLRPHAVVRGRHAKESAAIVTTFAGQAMQVASNAEPVLVTSDGAFQGAVMRIEMGRAAFFGDTALFTAQITGPERRLVGMNQRGARNFQFVLNVMHWLSGVI